MLAPWRLAARPSVRLFSTSSWGVDGLRWCNEATKGEGFYGFLMLRFNDADTNRDGFINFEEFDGLLENVAAVRCRCGPPPGETFNLQTRQMRHKNIFDCLDTKAGDARGVISCDQFVKWAQEHIANKEISDCSTLAHGVLELERRGFIEGAVNIPGSCEESYFYYFILSCFVEAECDSYRNMVRNGFIQLATGSHGSTRRSRSVPKDSGSTDAGSSSLSPTLTASSLATPRNGPDLEAIPRALRQFITLVVIWYWPKFSEALFRLGGRALVLSPNTAHAVFFDGGPSDLEASEKLVVFGFDDLKILIQPFQNNNTVGKGCKDGLRHRIFIGPLNLHVHLKCSKAPTGLMSRVTVGSQLMEPNLDFIKELDSSGGLQIKAEFKTLIG